METLSGLIIEAAELGFLEVIHINGSCSKDILISHLLFAEDTLNFCKPEESHLGYLRCILVLFEVMSRSKLIYLKVCSFPLVRCHR